MCTDNELTFADRDEFNRKPIAQKLIKLLNSDTEISPVVIDGPWGSGKTEFCKKTIQLAIEDKSLTFIPLYINSYKYDHSDDPFLMLITGISSLISDDGVKEDFISRSIPVAKVFGKFAGKAAISWIFKESADAIGKEAAESLASNSGGLVDYGIKQVFKDFEEIDNNLNLLKEMLKKVTNDKKIVIFIDELDRCRPTFALSLLEKVKHVFDVPRVQFVFTTNVVQLCAVVKQQYGNNIDAEDYLSKFFHLKIQLSGRHSPNGHDFYQNAFVLLDDLLDSLEEYRPIWGGSSSSTKFMMRYFFEKDERSLRDAEKYFRNLQVFNAVEGAFSIKPNNIWVYTALMMLSVYIHTFDTAFSKKIFTNRYIEEDISKFFGMKLDVLKNKGRNNLVTTMYALFILDLDEMVLKTAIDEETIKKWNPIIDHMFEAGFSQPEQGQRVEIVRKSMRVMQFH